MRVVDFFVVIKRISFDKNRLEVYFHRNKMNHLLYFFNIESGALLVNAGLTDKTNCIQLTPKINFYMTYNFQETFMSSTRSLYHISKEFL